MTSSVKCVKSTSLTVVPDALGASPSLSLSPTLPSSLIHPQCRGPDSHNAFDPVSSRAVNYSVRIAEKLEELCRDACAGTLGAEIKPATRGSPAIQITCHGETGFYGVTSARARTHTHSWRCTHIVYRYRSSRRSFARCYEFSL